MDTDATFKALEDWRAANALQIKMNRALCEAIAAGDWQKVDALEAESKAIHQSCVESMNRLNAALDEARARILQRPRDD